ncbi:MAG: CvpA family protein [Armatimonadota bacterium]
MSNWLDIVIVIMFIVIIAAEVKRGFGKALFDFAAFLVAIWGSYNLFKPVLKFVMLSPDPHTNQAIVFGSLFVILGIIMFFVGKFLYETTLISADVFDQFLGGVLGFGIAIIICHAMIRVIALNGWSNGLPEIITTSVLGKELLTFETYKQFLQALYNFDK